MPLGEKLLMLRKKAGLSQEEAAERLNVSRQTISKWETGQTIPELSKVRLLSELYNVSYGCIINEGAPADESAYINTVPDEIDWTKAWSTKYPILENYPKIEGIDSYCEKVSQLHDDMVEEFGFSQLDGFLVVKDILYQKYKNSKSKGK